MRIEPLAANPGFIPELARIFRAEWSHLVPAWSEEDFLATVRQRARVSGLPFSLVLKDEVGDLAGVVSLKESDLDARPELGPWLASLYVKPALRRQGHALSLIGAMEAEARLRGYRQLYLFTEDLVDFYGRRGYRILDLGERAGHSVTIMVKELASQ